ncbi:MAG: NAD(P)H-hydrate dehydratase [Bacteroidales bacterium]|nr:NAD(P)H-hydrate dehydratase [Bacteroidales bacterium]
MYIYKNSEIRRNEAFTMRQSGIFSYELMEKAANGCVAKIKDLVANTHTKFSVCCGTGKNGGDGLAIARLLHESGFAVEVFVVSRGSFVDADTQQNLDKLPVTPVFVTNEEQVPTVFKGDFIIDALFGIGLNRPVEGVFAKFINAMNISQKPIIAIDTPSGLFCDCATPNTCVVVEARHTLAIQTPKLAFMFPENDRKVGQFHLIDINLVAEEEPQEGLVYYQDNDLCNLLKDRPRNSHKGNYGRALLVCGSKGKMGAAILAAKGCLRSGVGLLTTRVPECGYAIMQTAVPEAMCDVDTNNDYATCLPEIDVPKYDAIGIGPGISLQAEALLEDIIKQQPRNLVLDADAITILAQHPSWLELLPPNTVLTPHAEEFRRLTKQHFDSDFDMFSMQQQFSKQHSVYVVLKGANTCITAPCGHTYFNSTGNAGMATGGSGDVLTGIITALLAQHYAPDIAARLGVYLHGKAGDLALQHQSVESLTPSDLISHLGEAFNFLRNRGE